MSRPIGRVGLEMIKVFEGCRLEAYQDAAGVQTIGYGHTSGVTAGMRITEAQAEEYLKADCQKFADVVDALGRDFNDNQRDALISFAFNLGAGNLKKVCANNRPVEQIAAAMPKYCNAGGKKSQGLVNRRLEEVKLFNTPCVSTVSVLAASAGSNNASRFVVGSCVVYSSCYASSTDPIAKAISVNPWKNGVVTKIKTGVPNGYAISDHVGGEIRCWCNEGDFR